MEDMFFLILLSEAYQELAFIQVQDCPLEIFNGVLDFDFFKLKSKTPKPCLLSFTPETVYLSSHIDGYIPRPMLHSLCEPCQFD
jgi:hypothetical protein